MNQDNRNQAASAGIGLAAQALGRIFGGIADRVRFRREQREERIRAEVVKARYDKSLQNLPPDSGLLEPSVKVRLVCDRCGTVWAPVDGMQCPHCSTGAPAAKPQEPAAPFLVCQDRVGPPWVGLEPLSFFSFPGPDGLVPVQLPLEVWITREGREALARHLTTAFQGSKFLGEPAEKITQASEAAVAEALSWLQERASVPMRARQ